MTASSNPNTNKIEPTNPPAPPSSTSSLSTVTLSSSLSSPSLSSTPSSTSLSSTPSSTSLSSSRKRSRDREDQDQTNNKKQKEEIKTEAKEEKKESKEEKKESKEEKKEAKTERNNMSLPNAFAVFEKTPLNSRVLRILDEDFNQIVESHKTLRDIISEEKDDIIKNKQLEALKIICRNATEIALEKKENSVSSSSHPKSTTSTHRPSSSSCSSSYVPPKDEKTIQLEKILLMLKKVRADDGLIPFLQTTDEETRLDILRNLLKGIKDDDLKREIIKYTDPATVTTDKKTIEKHLLEAGIDQEIINLFDSSSFIETIKINLMESAIKDQKLLEDPAFGKKMYWLNCYQFALENSGIPNIIEAFARSETARMIVRASNTQATKNPLSLAEVKKDIELPCRLLDKWCETKDQEWKKASFNMLTSRWSYAIYEKDREAAKAYIETTYVHYCNYVDQLYTNGKLSSEEDIKKPLAGNRDSLLATIGSSSREPVRKMPDEVQLLVNCNFNAALYVLTNKHSYFAYHGYLTFLTTFNLRELSHFEKVEPAKMNYHRKEVLRAAIYESLPKGDFIKAFSCLTTALINFDKPEDLFRVYKAIIQDEIKQSGKYHKYPTQYALLNNHLKDIEDLESYLKGSDIQIILRLCAEPDAIKLKEYMLQDNWSGSITEFWSGATTLLKTITDKLKNEQLYLFILIHKQYVYDHLMLIQQNEATVTSAMTDPIYRYIDSLNNLLPGRKKNTAPLSGSMEVPITELKTPVGSPMSDISQSPSSSSSSSSSTHQKEEKKEEKKEAKTENLANDAVNKSYKTLQAIRSEAKTDPVNNKHPKSTNPTHPSSSSSCSSSYVPPKDPKTIQLEKILPMLKKANAADDGFILFLQTTDEEARLDTLRDLLNVIKDDDLKREIIKYTDLVTVQHSLLFPFDKEVKEDIKLFCAFLDQGCETKDPEWISASRDILLVKWKKYYSSQNKIITAAYMEKTYTAYCNYLDQKNLPHDTIQNIKRKLIEHRDSLLLLAPPNRQHWSAPDELFLLANVHFNAALYVLRNKHENSAYHRYLRELASPSLRERSLQLKGVEQAKIDQHRKEVLMSAVHECLSNGRFVNAIDYLISAFNFDKSESEALLNEYKKAIQQEITQAGEYPTRCTFLYEHLKDIGKLESYLKKPDTMRALEFFAKPNAETLKNYVDQDNWSAALHQLKAIIAPLKDEQRYFFILIHKQMIYDRVMLKHNGAKVTSARTDPIYRYIDGLNNLLPRGEKNTAPLSDSMRVPVTELKTTVCSSPMSVIFQPASSSSSSSSSSPPDEAAASSFLKTEECKTLDAKIAEDIKLSCELLDKECETKDSNPDPEWMLASQAMLFIKWKNIINEKNLRISKRDYILGTCEKYCTYLDGLQAQGKLTSVERLKEAVKKQRILFLNKLKTSSDETPSSPDEKNSDEVLLLANGLLNAALYHLQKQRSPAAYTGYLQYIITAPDLTNVATHFMTQFSLLQNVDVVKINQHVEKVFESAVNFSLSIGSFFRALDYLLTSVLVSFDKKELIFKQYKLSIQNEIKRTGEEGILFAFFDNHRKDIEQLESFIKHPNDIKKIYKLFSSDDGKMLLKFTTQPNAHDMEADYNAAYNKVGAIVAQPEITNEQSCAFILMYKQISYVALLNVLTWEAEEKEAKEKEAEEKEAEEKEAEEKSGPIVIGPEQTKIEMAPCLSNHLDKLNQLYQRNLSSSSSSLSFSTPPVTLPSSSSNNGAGVEVAVSAPVAAGRVSGSPTLFASPKKEGGKSPENGARLSPLPLN